MNSSLFDGLESLLGPEGVIRKVDPESHYCRDWIGDYRGTPSVVLRPAGTEQVSALVRFCGQHGIKIVPQGGHTGLVGGAAPSETGDEVIVTLERMNKVRQLDPINFSMVAEAGCIVEAAQAAALEIDRYFPLSYGAQGSAHIGGAAATNAGGFNVLRYGMMRDLVLGLEVVLPDGQIWDGLRALRKNNSGYDLRHLFLGSEGTLGIITAAALKIFPRPTQFETAFLAVKSVEAAMSLYTLARRDLSDLLSAFELIPRLGVDLAREATPGLRDPLDQPSPYYVLLEVSASGMVGLKQLVERFLESMIEQGHIEDGILSASLAQSKELWRVREGMVEGQIRRGLHFRSDVSTAISLMAEFISTASARIEKELPGVTPLAFGHVGDGNVHFNAFPPPGLSPAESEQSLKKCEAIIFQLIDELGGSISAEHGIGRKRRTAFLQRTPAAQLDVLRRIKSALDPQNLLSPGRIF